MTTELLTTPTPETPETERPLSVGLDFYKLPMGQVAFEQHPDRVVTFTMKNRAGDYPLSQYVSVGELNETFDKIIKKGFTPEEIAYYAGIQASNGTARFSEDYLNFLADVELPPINVTIDEDTNDLAIQTKGVWPAVSLWETVVMSEVNEIYFRNLMKEQGLKEEDVWAEGDKRLSAKIDILKNRPDIKFTDFGTRRRFSAEWQEHVIGRLAKELPDNLVGTSNPWFAHKFGLAPIGTYAHEMPMVYAAIASLEGRNPLEGHNEMKEDWHDRYEEDLSIALTDTFTSKFFWADFTPEQAEEWKGLRHDSGDPIDFGEDAIRFYEERGIDTTTKTLVFSDGLDIDTIVKIADHFKDRTNIMFGWGTSLMNDLGLRPNNFVMKATEVDGEGTVKLSDNAGKHTGTPENVERYNALVEARLEVANIFAEMERV
ncbi:MAG: nicotinate phosphoribosyltransferase [Candidatus Microsaccharimonas sp.]